MLKTLILQPNIVKTLDFQTMSCVSSNNIGLKYVMYEKCKFGKEDLKIFQPLISVKNRIGVKLVVFLLKTSSATRPDKWK